MANTIGTNPQPFNIPKSNPGRNGTHIKSGRLNGRSVTNSPGINIVGDQGTPPPGVAKNTKLDTFTYFSTLWEKEPISDIEIALAVRFDILSQGSCEDFNDAKNIFSENLPNAELNIVSQVKEQLYYKMLNKELSDDQRKCFQHIRNTCPPSEISDACLFTFVKQKSGKLAEYKVPEKRPQAFINRVNQKALVYAMKSLKNSGDQHLRSRNATTTDSTSSIKQPAKQLTTTNSSSPSVENSQSHKRPHRKPQTKSGIQAQSSTQAKPVSEKSHLPETPQTTTPTPKAAVTPNNHGNTDPSHRKEITHTQLINQFTEDFIPKLEKKFGLKQKVVPDDGNCFYTSAATQIKIDSDELRQQMHEKATELLSCNDQKTKNFFKASEDSQMGFNRDELSEQVDKKHIKTPSPSDKTKSHEQLWGDVRHLPLLALTTGRPIMFFSLSDQPEPIYFDKHGHICIDNDRSKEAIMNDPDTVRLVHDGRAHFNALMPTNKRHYQAGL